MVSPGTYYEHIDFQGKNLVLRSEDPANPSVVASTIIDGGSRGDILIVEIPPAEFSAQKSVVTFCHGETRQAKLAGFTIQNGEGNTITVPLGGGLYIRDASPAIEHNVIRNNHAAWGGGILVGGQSSPWIAFNTIQDNSATTSGAGIVIVRHASPIIHKNLFLRNRAQNAGGGIFVESTAGVRNITGLFWPRENCPPAGVNSSNTWTYQGNTFFGNTHRNGQASDGSQVYFLE